MAKTVRLTFEGYWTGQGIGAMPDLSGVYAVYAAREAEGDATPEPEYLIYIGYSACVRDAILNHERRRHWASCLDDHSVLAYSFALAPKQNRERAAAALINIATPRCNVEFVRSYPFNDTTVISSGACRFIDAVVTARKLLPY